MHSAVEIKEKLSRRTTNVVEKLPEGATRRHSDNSWCIYIHVDRAQRLNVICRLVTICLFHDVINHGNHSRSLCSRQRRADLIISLHNMLDGCRKIHRWSANQRVLRKWKYYNIVFMGIFYGFTRCFLNKRQILGQAAGSSHTHKANDQQIFKLQRITVRKPSVQPPLAPACLSRLSAMLIDRMARHTVVNTKQVNMR